MNSRNMLAVGALIVLVAVVIGPKALSLDWQSVYRFSYVDEKPDLTDHKLEAIIQQDLQDQPGDYAVVIKRLGSSEADFSLHSDLIFPSASLYKLVLMAATFEASKSGKLSMDTKLSSTKVHLDQVLQDDESDYLDLPEVVVFSVAEALDRIARISDNYASIMLTEKLRSIGGEDPLQLISRQLGMTHTDFSGDQPVTTASDVSLFFQKLYVREVVSKEASDLVMALLRRNQINDRIPALLPKEVQVAHKTGELPYIRHDAGIVFMPDKPYIIVLMSQNLKYEDDGVDLLAKISKDVYNYFLR